MFSIDAYYVKHNFSKKEKKDVEDLEVPETKRLFLEQNTLDAKQSKEQKEYLDALNKEVIYERSNTALF